MNTWQCPGPNRMLLSIQEKIEDKHSLFLLIPPLSPDGVKDSVSTLLSRSGWVFGELKDSKSSPTRQAYEAAYLSEDLERELQPSDLLDRKAFSGKVYWCEPTDEDAVLRWITFLDSYALARRANPEADGPNFIVALCGELSYPPPSRKIGFIEVIDVVDAVSQTDLLMLAYHQIGTTAIGGPLVAQVHAQVAASLAVWDVKLLHRLLDLSLDQLFDPLSSLHAYALELGWSASTPINRQSGTLKSIAKKNEQHSAILALNDPNKIIESRVWAGQAAVLLPVIERRRIELIDRYRPTLSGALPFKSDFDMVNHVFDLEIGHVCHLLNKLHGSKTSAAMRALRLKKLRNKLAHLEPLLPNEAFSEDIVGSS